MSNEKLQAWHKKKELDHIACYSYIACCALIIEKVFFVVVLSNLEDADSVDEHLLAQK